MNRANQQALFQATNQGLLSIRQAEINYYLNLNLAFGTQAALIGGFTYGVFTQNPLNNDNNYGEVINDVCWITSAATIATAVHVILNTMLLQVYGPGLALHGPVGSIARATEGMKFEQKQIVTSFMLMMFFFSVSTTLSFWVVMNLESAAGSTAVFIIAARYWYYYTERIYLRFYWDAEKDAWNDGNDGGENEYMPPAVTGDSIRVRGAGGGGAAGEEQEEGSVASRGSGSGSKKKNRGRVAQFFSKIRGAAGGGGGGRTTSTDSRGSTKTNVFTVAGTGAAGGGGAANILDKSGFQNSTKKLMAMEGYLTKSGITRPDNKKEPWERRYFALTKAGLLYFYKSRMDFRSNPKAPINNRPLNINEYYVTLSNSDETARQLSTDPHGHDDDDDDPPLMHRTSNNFFTNVSVDYSVRSKGTTTKSPLLGKHVFEMVLVLRDEQEAARSKQWILRCDTEEELDIWVGCIRAISPESFRD